MLSVIVLAAGCTNKTGAMYCDHAFEFEYTLEEIDATPIGIVRQIVLNDDLVIGLCK